MAQFFIDKGTHYYARLKKLTDRLPFTENEREAIFFKNRRVRGNSDRTVIRSMDGFLPSYYIRSGALSKSPFTVSLRDTRLVSENGKNPLCDNYMNFHKVEKCRIYGTFLIPFIFYVTSILRTQRALSSERNQLRIPSGQYSRFRRATLRPGRQSKDCRRSSRSFQERTPQ